MRERSGQVGQEIDGSMSPPILFFIILIEGFITLSAEILTLRQLLPVVGNSVIVTSLIIGVFLLFLAYGYRRGGKYRRQYAEILKRNFTLAAILFGIGLSYIFVYAFFGFFGRTLNLSLLWTLSLYLILITAPLIYILGQTVPITMNLVKHASSTGEIGGKILHLSTLGSFLGSVLTTLILMQFLGVAWTVFVNFALLFLLVILLFSSFHKDVIRLIILVSATVLVYGLNVAFEKNLFVKSNAYGNYEIITDANAHSKFLVINESMSSYLKNNKKSFPYIELMKRILFEDLKLNEKEILVLGAGGFTLSVENTFRNNFTYVDIDKDILGVVQKHFNPDIHGTLVIEDARAFLNRTEDNYDVIISDAYSNARSIPAQLLTQEYFQLVHRRLKKEGIALFNFIIRATFEDPYSINMDATLRSVFPQCMVIPIKYSSAIDNVVYLCRKTESSSKLYRDDLNPSTLDFFNFMKK